MEPEGLLPCSPESSNDPIPEPEQFSPYHSILGSWDSAVFIAIGYGLDDREVGVRVPVGLRIFCSLHLQDQL
jgi:hypothetical protein